MGGGRTKFMRAGVPDHEHAGLVGRRLDGRDLIAEWKARHPRGAYAWNERQLQALDLAHMPQLLGLFEPMHMNYEHERPHDLAGMTTSAIEVLKQNPKGIFLMVEGGLVDYALYAGNAYRALDETISLADAVNAALAHTDPANTLIVVTPTTPAR